MKIKDETLIVVAVGAVIGLIVVWLSLSGVGKYQLCKYYFSEMSRPACFFTSLPAVNTRRK